MLILIIHIIKQILGKAAPLILMRMQQTFWKGKATAKATVSDIFQTMRWCGTSNFAGQYIKVNGGFESRQLRLSMIYRFGNTQVKAARQRKTAAEEESQRVGNQGGGLNN